MTYQFDDPGLRANEIQGKTVEQIADVLAVRLAKIKSQVATLDSAQWKSEFVKKCEEVRKQDVLVWEARWQEMCDGKRLFHELFKRQKFKISLARFKKTVMLRMRSRPTANWRSVESLLKRLIEK
jgi:hypothetical protein